MAPAVEPQSAVKWNDPRHPQAQESFGAVPAVAPVVGGGSILNGFPSHGGLDDVSDDGRFCRVRPAMIVERVKAGLARARSMGKRLGRRPVNAEIVEQIRAQLATGAGILKAGMIYGYARLSLHRKSVSKK